ncbi:MAG: hypothetical protein ACLQGV_03370, partial [Bryobacteraceae bacterium]
QQPVTGLTWASSDTTVVSLSTDDPPILTAVAAGHVTITAGTAAADVTVWATTLPLGTVLWSNPGDGSGVTSIVPAVPSGYGVADVFAFQGDGTVQAITGDGTTAWTAAVPPMWPTAVPQMRRAAAPRMRPAGRYRQPSKLHPQSAEQDQQPAVVVPDFLGGLVMMTGDSIMGLDGTTGQPTFTYTLPDGSFWASDPAVHPDGTIFAILEGDSWSLIGIDPSTGATKFSVPIPPSNVSQAPAGDIIIAGDGYAYAPHSYADISSPCGPDFTSSQLDHLMLLRVGSDGSYDDFDVFDWASPSFCHEGGIINSLGMITNADQGILLTWQGFDGSGNLQHMAVTAGASASVVGTPGAYVTPVLQLQDGSFAGTAWDVDYTTQSMIGFDASGNLLWSVGGNWQPQIATADGGLIVTDQDTGAAIKYDQSGNAKWQLADGGAVYAWDQEWYDLLAGTVADVVEPPLPIATSWGGVPGEARRPMEPISGQP